MSKKHIKPLSLAKYEERKAMLLSCRKFEEMVIFDKIDRMHRNPEEREYGNLFCYEVFKRLGGYAEPSLIREIARTMNYNIMNFIARYCELVEDYKRGILRYRDHDRWWEWLDALEKEWEETRKQQEQ